MQIYQLKTGALGFSTWQYSISKYSQSVIGFSFKRNIANNRIVFNINDPFGFIRT